MFSCKNNLLVVFVYDNFKDNVKVVLKEYKFLSKLVIFFDIYFNVFLNR